MDYILLSKMKFYGHTGCFEEEKQNGQTFYVTVRLGIDSILGSYTDELEDTVNYAEVYEICKSIVTTYSNNLIEYLAGKIADKILEFDSRIDEAEVTVSKPEAPVNGEFETMAVTITRHKKQEVYLSLGSNIGDKMENLRTALEIIKNNPRISDVRVSNVYETEPWGYKNQDIFYNICVGLKTDIEPSKLILFTQSIEKNMHRVKTIVDGPRNIDVDILTYGDLSVNLPNLQIPHPRMNERAFVLVPLKELTEVNIPIPDEETVNRIGEL